MFSRPINETVVLVEVDDSYEQLKQKYKSVTTMDQMGK